MASLKKEAGAVVVDVEHIVSSSLALAEGAVSFVSLMFVFSTVLIYLIGFGIAAIVLRAFFFFLIPVLIRRADIVVGVINLMINSLVLFSDAVITVIDASIAVADAFGGNANVIPYWHFQTVTVSEYKHAMTSIAEECRSYTTISEMWVRTAFPSVSESVCPYARAAYPVMGNVAGALALEGVVSASADPYTNNCAVEAMSPYAPTCVALGSGYIIIEVLVPFLVLCIFLMCEGNALRHVVWHTSTLIIYVAYHLVEVVFRALRWVARLAAGGDDDGDDVDGDETKALL